MRSLRLAFLGWAAALALTTMATQASAGTAYVVTRSGPGIIRGLQPRPESRVEALPVDSRVQPGAYQVIDRPVANRAATVSRALAEQPVYPYLVELKQGLITVYLDPAHDYRGQGPGRLDENNSILKALRMPRHYQRATDAYIVTCGPIKRQPQATAIVPRAIIPMPSSDDPFPQPRNLMPAVPRQTAPAGPQLARADH